MTLRAKSSSSSSSDPLRSQADQIRELEKVMAIDATILGVERDGVDVVLTLGNRLDDADQQSIAGQPKFRIVNATWTPEPGMDIWGGGSSVQIVTKRGERDPVTNNAIGPWYRRNGYTRLVEDF